MPIHSVLIHPALDIDVGFWGFDPQRANDPQKIRLIDVHSSRPLVAAVAEAARERHSVQINIWDYSAQTAVVSTTLAEILANFGTSQSRPLFQADPIPRQKTRPPAEYIGVRTLSTSNQLPRSRSSILAPSLHRHGIRGMSSTSDNFKAPGVLVGSNKSCVGGKGGTSASDEPFQSSHHLIAGSSGTIKQISFIDRTTIEAVTGYVSPTKDGTPGKSCFNSDFMIMIVTESVVVFFDYAIRRSFIVNCSDALYTPYRPGSGSMIAGIAAAIGSSSAGFKPTCAEFWYYNLCCIGCADGAVRVWDCRRWKQVKMMQSTISKGDIAVLKCLPVASCADSAANKLRLFILGHDGVGILWEGLVKSGNSQGPTLEVDASPVARLREPIGSALTRTQIVYDHETQTLQTCVNERKIRLWDISTVSSPPDRTRTRAGTGGAGGGSHGGSTVMSASAASTGMGDSTTGVASKRGSLLSGVGGGNSPDNSYYDSEFSYHDAPPTAFSAAGNPNFVQGIPCVGSFKPDRGGKATGRAFPTSLQKITSFAPLRHPRFPAGTFFVASKGSNSIGIVQSNDFSAGDDDDGSERSSVVSSAVTEKSSRFELLHELSLSLLMESFFQTVAAQSHALQSSSSSAATTGSIGLQDATLSTTASTAAASAAVAANLGLPSSVISSARDPSAKVYALWEHPTQPHLVVLATSVGVVLLSLPALPSSSMLGMHPKWGSERLMSDNWSIRRTSISPPPAASYSSSPLTPSSTAAHGRHLLESNFGSTAALLQINPTASALNNSSTSMTMGALQQRRMMSGHAPSDGSHLASPSRTVAPTPAFAVASPSNKMGFRRTLSGISRKASFRVGSTGAAGGGREDSISAGGSAHGAGGGSSHGAGGGAVGTGVGIDGNGGDAAGAVSPSPSSFPVSICAQQSSLSFAPTAALTSRPNFIPSPSGSYCAVVWPESKIYVIIYTESSSASISSSSGGMGVSSQGMVEVDRGYCLSLAWVGVEDEFLLTTPAYLCTSSPSSSTDSNSSSSNSAGKKGKRGSDATPMTLDPVAAVGMGQGQGLHPQPTGPSSAKQRRSSILQVLNVFGGNKDTREFLPPRVLLKQCVRCEEAAPQTTSSPSSSSSSSPPSVQLRCINNDFSLSRSEKELRGPNTLSAQSTIERADHFIALHGGLLLNVTFAHSHTYPSSSSSSSSSSSLSFSISSGGSGGAAEAGGGKEAASSTSKQIAAKNAEQEKLAREYGGQQGVRRPNTRVYSRFYCLLSGPILKRHLADAAAAAAANTIAGRAARRTSSAATTVAAALAVDSFDGSALVAVGPVLGVVDHVCWDFETKRCAVLLAQGRIVSILKLEMPQNTAASGSASGSIPRLFTLCTVNVHGAGSIPMHVSTTNIWWDAVSGVLFIGTSTGVSMVGMPQNDNSSNSSSSSSGNSSSSESSAEIIRPECARIPFYSKPGNASYGAFLPVLKPILGFSVVGEASSGSTKEEQVIFPVPMQWTELVGAADGHVFLVSRDGKLFSLPIGSSRYAAVLYTLYRLHAFSCGVIDLPDGRDARELRKNNSDDNEEEATTTSLSSALSASAALAQNTLMQEHLAWLAREAKERKVQLVKAQIVQATVELSASEQNAVAMLLLSRKYFAEVMALPSISSQIRMELQRLMLLEHECNNSNNNNNR